MVPFHAEVIFFSAVAPTKDIRVGVHLVLSLYLGVFNMLYPGV